MSQVRTSIVLGGRGAHSRRNDRNADKAIVFHNFLKASQGLLASIVGGKFQESSQDGSVKGSIQSEVRLCCNFCTCVDTCTCYRTCLRNGLLVYCLCF